MKQISTSEELSEAIEQLELRHSQSALHLKEQLRITYENLKPANLIKNTLHDLVTTPDLKDGIWGSMVSRSAGYMSKNLIMGSSLNPLKILSGNLLQLLVTTLVSKNIDGIKRGAAYLLSKISVRKKTEV